MFYALFLQQHILPKSTRMLRRDGNTEVGQVARAEFFTISCHYFLERYRIAYLSRLYLLRVDIFYDFLVLANYPGQINPRAKQLK